MLVKPEDKIAIYTAVIGNCDKEIPTSSYVDDNVDMFLYTDNKNIIAKDRKIIIVNKPKTIDNARSSRIYKIRADSILSKYKYSLWIDGHVSIVKSIRRLINDNIPEDDFSGLAFMDHPCRDCIYDEAQFCIEHKKDYCDTILKQVQSYRENGFPEHNGLIRGTVIFREHNRKSVIDLMSKWLNKVIFGSRRDQLSFNYVAWLYGFKYNHLNKNFYTEYFKQHRHHNYTV